MGARVNRAGAREARQANDSYPTPGWAVRRILEVDPQITGLWGNGTWCEPACGNGAIVHEVRRAYPRVAIVASDIVEPPMDLGANLAYRLDYLSGGGDYCNVIITNPPYSIAEDFVRVALKHADVVCMLLRLGFAASEGRRDWLAETNPSIFVLPNRPAFARKWKCPNCKEHGLVDLSIAEHWHNCMGPVELPCTMATDSSDYGWFIWGAPETGKIHWLASTPAEERR